MNNPGLVIRRLAAVFAAIVMVGGALVLRSTVFDADTDDEPAAGRDIQVVWCISELAEACEAAFAGTQISVEIIDAELTLQTLTTADATDLDHTTWITFAGLPAAGDRLRTSAGRAALSSISTELAQSAIIAASPGPLGAECDVNPFRCAATTGFPRAPHSASRYLTTVVALDQALDGGIDTAASSLGVVAARPLLGALAETRLSSPSAIATMCSRPTFDLALGTRSELERCAAASLTVSYSDSMLHAVVASTTFGGQGLPGENLDRLRNELIATGWEPYADAVAPDAVDLLIARTVWSQM